MDLTFERFAKFRDMPPPHRMLASALIVNLVGNSAKGSLVLNDEMEFFALFTNHYGEHDSLCFHTRMMTIDAQAYAWKCPGLVAFIAVQPHPGCRWLQYVWTAVQARKQGLFRRLVGEIEKAYPGEKLGLGTDSYNASMRSAAEKCGFRQTVVYYDKEPKLWTKPVDLPSV